MSFCQEIIRTVLNTTERILSNPNVAQVYVWHDQAKLVPSLPSEFVELPMDAKVNEVKEIATVLGNKPPDIILLDGCDSYAKIRMDDDGTWALYFSFLICVASRLTVSERGKQAVIAALVISLIHEIGHAKLRNAVATRRHTPPGWTPPNRSREESGYMVEYFLLKGYPHLLSHKGAIEALGFRSADGSLRAIDPAWTERFLSDFDAPLAFYQSMTSNSQPAGPLGVFLDDSKARGGCEMETCSGVEDMARIFGSE